MDDVRMFNVTTSVSGKGGVSCLGGVWYVEGSKIEIHAVPDTGWKVDHWMVNDDYVNSAENVFVIDSIDKDYYLMVVFTEDINDDNADDTDNYSPSIKY